MGKSPSTRMARTSIRFKKNSRPWGGCLGVEDTPASGLGWARSIVPARGGQQGLQSPRSSASCRKPGTQPSAAEPRMLFGSRWQRMQCTRRTPSTGPGMGLVVAVPHPLCGKMGVDLRGRKRFVTEQFLDASQVGTVVQQVRRERVAKRVRADRRVEARPPGDGAAPATRALPRRTRRTPSAHAPRRPADLLTKRGTCSPL